MGGSASGHAQGHTADDAARAEGLDLLKVLEYCPWQQRAAVAVLSPEVRQKLGHQGAADEAGGGACHWRFLCERLAAEHNVHVPQPMGGRPDLPPPGVAASWRSLFLELFPVRSRLDGSLAAEDSSADGAAGQAGQFLIKVAARFRPAGSQGAEEEQAVVLPLHQKVQIVRDRYSCSKNEAMKLIMRERGLMSLDDPFSSAEVEDKENHDETQQPVVMKGKEACTAAGDALAKAAVEELVEVEADEEDEEEDAEETRPAAARPSSDLKVSILAVREDAGSVLAVAPGVGLRDFVFDSVFAEKACQANTYDMCAQRLVVDFLNGTNASVICYGQTGSGKTYTMFGPTGAKAGRRSEQGIVPRACEEVLQSMHARRACGVETELGMSYVEIFGSEVSDLLREGRVVGQDRDGRYANVRATDRVGHRYVLDGHTELSVESWEDVHRLLESGDQAKRLAATAMNERSTRAHALLVLTLTQKLPSGFQVRSRLFLADLGGSEKVSKSKADTGLVAPVTMVGGVETGRVGWQEYYRHRQRLQETLAINQGLFALKKVIEALHAGQQMKAEGAPSHLMPYVPYQDSKLTMILKDALGGSSRTLVFCTASMDGQHATESLQTLRFGERCAQVQQRTNADKAASVQAALRQIEEDIKAVEAEIVRKERWETRLVKRRDVDTVAGAFGEQHGNVIREEVIPTSVLVGAEREREELERLLQKQLDLQGLRGLTSKDYREMRAQEADDGGKGRDFRERDTFGRVTKAKEFEQEAVLAGSLRHIFRKARRAEEAFGETEARRRQRKLVHPSYFKLAEHLRAKWEREVEEGKEKRSLGKSMLDLTQEWQAAFKADAGKRDEVLGKLLEEVPELLSSAASASAS